MRAAALATLLLLAACATPPVVFDRSNLAQVQRMDVLTPGFPPRPTVAVLPPTDGALFLLINGIQEGNRSREFATFLARANADPEADFAKALLACLTAAGVRPTLAAGDARRTRILREYGALAASGGDAVLDVVVTRYGYYAVTNASPFEPTATIQARLVNARDRGVLMQETINMVNVVPADPAVGPASFQDYSDIAANPDAAVRALRSAMTAAANAVCKRLT